MSLEDVDILELQDRYLYLIDKYVKLAQQIAPLLDQFGKYRNELQLLSAEFAKRGVAVNDPEGLKKAIEEELEKRNPTTDVENQTE